jgi:pimeloyl-ACP methyl ester carboxylesterase
MSTTPMVAVPSATSTKFLVRPQGRIAYEEAGAGPLVVMVPGMGDVRAQYRFLASHLVTAGYRAIAMDLRGLGESSTGWDDYSAAAVGADIVALLRELNAGPAHLVGGSMAAAAIAWAAAEAPDLVQSLVMIGPFVRDVPPASPMQGLIIRLMLDVGLMRPWGARGWSSFYASLYPTSKPADFDAYLQALKANVGQKGRLEALQAMTRASKATAEARLGQVRAPTLVVMGTKDPDFTSYAGGPEGEARLVAERLRGSVLMVEGAGHYPHAEMPEETGPAIRRFLDAHQSHSATQPLQAQPAQLAG